MNEQPYRFLRNYEFTNEDARVFFGRKREAAALEAEITNRHLVILFAPTGTGKSSLINAGVRPNLEKRGYKTLFLPPKRDPEESVLLKLEEERLLDRKVARLPEILRAARERAGAPLVLLFDQFEEFFLYVAQENPERVQPFVRAVAELYRDRNSGIHFLFSLREDFFVEMDIFRDEIPTLFQANSSLRLRAFDINSAREAIVGPARVFKVSYVESEKTLNDEGDSAEAAQNRKANQKFIDQILSDLQLPWTPHKASPPGRISPIHLQIVCDTLWSKRRGSVIDREVYESTGGVRRILHKRFHDDFAGRLTNHQLFIFERLLPLLRSDRERGTKRILAVSLLPEQLHVKEEDLSDLIEELVCLRLLLKGSRGTIEWASDYLSGQCDRLLLDIRSIRVHRAVTTALSRSQSAAAGSAAETSLRVPPSESELEAQYMKPEEFHEISQVLKEELLPQFEAMGETSPDMDVTRVPNATLFLLEASLEHGEELKFWHRVSIERGHDPYPVLRSKVRDPSTRTNQAVNAIRLLASLQTREALEILREVLAGDSWARSATAAELGQYATDEILALLRDFSHRQQLSENELLLMSRNWTRQAKALFEKPESSPLSRRRAKTITKTDPHPPGQAGNGLAADADWELLVKLVADGSLIPVIGQASISKDMAVALAKEVDYPGEPSDFSLVAEYAEGVAARTLIYEFLTEFNDKTRIPEWMHALARLPIRTFITSRFDRALFTALQVAGKEPVETEWERDGSKTEPMIRHRPGDAGHPLVHHLLGTVGNRSAVVTATDQLRFMIASGENAESLPLALRALLARSSCLYLDVQPGTQEFRMLAAQLERTRALHRNFSYWVPGDSAASDRLTQQFLRSDSLRMGLLPYGGEADQFVNQLVERWSVVQNA